MSKKAVVIKRPSEDNNDGPSVSRVDSERRYAPSDRPPYNDSRQGYGGNKEYSDRRVSFQNPSSPRQREVRCESCLKPGHEKSDCWKLATCDYCMKVGHPLKICRAFVEAAMEARTQVNEGTMSGEEVAKQLNG
jgi:hypothetical protein